MTVTLTRDPHWTNSWDRYTDSAGRGVGLTGVRIFVGLPDNRARGGDVQMCFGEASIDLLRSREGTTVRLRAEGTEFSDRTQIVRTPPDEWSNGHRWVRFSADGGDYVLNYSPAVVSLREYSEPDPFFQATFDRAWTVRTPSTEQETTMTTTTAIVAGDPSTYPLSHWHDDGPRVGSVWEYRSREGRGFVETRDRDGIGRQGYFRWGGQRYFYGFGAEDLTPIPFDRNDESTYPASHWDHENHLPVVGSWWTPGPGFQRFDQRPVEIVAARPAGNTQTSARNNICEVRDDRGNRDQYVEVPYAAERAGFTPYYGEAPTETVTDHPASDGRDVTDAHREDMRIVSEALQAEARRRGWCSEYEDVIARINSTLTVPLRARTTKVRICVEAEVPNGVAIGNFQRAAEQELRRLVTDRGVTLTSYTSERVEG